MCENFSIQEVESHVKAIYQSLNNAKPLSAYVTFDIPSQYAFPFIKIGDDGYHFIVMERGRVLENRITRNFEELLYWIFSDITFEMALNEIFNHPCNTMWEQRRVIFNIQLSLLKKISSDFANRQKTEILEILARHPFTDGRPNTPDYDGD